MMLKPVDKHSTLFAITTSHAVRSYWYGILNALPHLIAIAVVPILGFISELKEQHNCKVVSIL